MCGENFKNFDHIDYKVFAFKMKETSLLGEESASLRVYNL